MSAASTAGLCSGVASGRLQQLPVGCVKQLVQVYVIVGELEEAPLLLLHFLHLARCSENNVQLSLGSEPFTCLRCCHRVLPGPDLDSSFILVALVPVLVEGGIYK